MANHKIIKEQSKDVFNFCLTYLIGHNNTKVSWRNAYKMKYMLIWHFNT